MAQVSMDLSELKAMEKNAELLEKSLQKEEESHKKILKLEKEKIEILEQNDKQVTIIKQVDTHEHMTIAYSVDEAYDKIVRFFKERGTRKQGNRIVTDSHMLMDSPDNYQFHHHSRVGMRDMPLSYHQGDWDHLFHHLFKKVTSQNMATESRTYKGLDEVTEDIRKELTDGYLVDMKENDLAKIAEYTILRTKAKEDEELIASLRNDNTKLTENYQGLSNDLDVALKVNHDLVKKHSKIMAHIESGIEGIFAYKKFYTKLMSIVKLKKQD